MGARAALQNYGVDLARALGHKPDMKIDITSLCRSLIPALLWAPLGLMLSGCGQGGTVDGKIADARARNDGPAIWYIKDHDSTLYLFGTVHLLPADIDWVRGDMESIFRDAGTVFFEIDTRASAQIEATVLTQDLGFRSDGLRLSGQLDSYQLKLMEAAANNSGISYATLDNMEPWLASEFLVVAAAANAGLSPELSADNALKSRAAAQGKNIVYLDTMEGQITRSAEQPDFVQMKMLSDTLEGFNGLGSDLNKVAQAWSVGQTNYLTRELIIETQNRSPDIYQTLFDDVNRAWARPLTRFMEGSGTGFAAIGTGHLLGEHSLQELMAEQGYKTGRYYAFKGENVIRTVPLNPVNGEN